MSGITIAGIIILVYLFTPVPSSGNTWYFAQAEKNNNLDKTPIKNCVETINALPLKHPVVSFLAEKAIYQYSDKLINSVTIFYDGIPVEDFIKSNNLELIVMSNLLMTNNMVNQINGFNEFIMNPEKLKFKKINIENTSNYLLVSTNALNK